MQEEQEVEREATPEHIASYALKNIPSDEKAEFYIIGLILINNDNYNKICHYFNIKCFSDKLVRSIYEHISSMLDRGFSIDCVNLHSFIIKSRPYSNIEANLLFDLINSSTLVVNSEMNIEYYVDVVVTFYKKRELMTLFNKSWESIRKIEIYDNNKQKDKVDEIICNIDDIMNIELSREKRGFISIGDSMRSSIEILLDKLDGNAPVVKTGFSKLDEKCGYFEPGDLIIVAGRPGMGKTALAINIAINAAKKGKKIGFFSLEMPAYQINHRILAQEARIAPSMLRGSNLTIGHVKAMQEASERISGLPLMIDDSSQSSLEQISLRARKIHEKEKIDLLIIDHLQLMQGNSNKVGNRLQEITHITMGLKLLAKELAVPIIALSQLSRDVEKRSDQRPQLSDLRESGSIEQDADLVMFLYREYYYIRRKIGQQDVGKARDDLYVKLENAKGKAEVIVEKSRHGETGSVMVGFDERLMQFWDM